MHHDVHAFQRPGHVHGSGEISDDRGIRLARLVGGTAQQRAHAVPVGAQVGEERAADEAGGAGESDGRRRRHRAALACSRGREKRASVAATSPAARASASVSTRTPSTRTQKTASAARRQETTKIVADTSSAAKPLSVARW